MTAPAPNPHLAEIRELETVCKRGDLNRATELLRRNPQILDTPDRDPHGPCPESFCWSPIAFAALNGHEALVRRLLDMGANPVPYDVSGQYHHLLYEDWMLPLRERGYHGIIAALEEAIQRRYGPLLDDANIRQAVMDRNLERVRALLAEKPERVRQVDAVANTPLHLAVASNQIDMVRLLLDHGAPIDARNGDGRTPMVAALFSLHRGWRDAEKKEAADLLLQRGAEYTMLIAATRGDVDHVRKLLLANPALANAPDACFGRPLSAAAMKGHWEIVRLLLEHGANPNAKEPCCQGGFALYQAVWKGHTEIVRLLLDYGAVPNHWVDSSGDAVYAAHHNGHKEILQLLYAKGATMDLSIYAAAHRIDVVAEVLHLKPELANKVFPPGWDEGGSEEQALNIMRLAIHHGARFEDAGGWDLRWTALQYPRVFQLLQAHGANPNRPFLGLCDDMRRRYDSPEQQLGVIKFLVEQCGADVNSRQEDELTALALAARAGHLDIVQYLISKGADLNPKGPDWSKPLALATSRNFKEIMEVLKQNGV